MLLILLLTSLSCQVFCKEQQQPTVHDLNWAILEDDALNIIKQHPELASGIDSSGRTPLYTAAFIGNVPVTQVLLNAQANPNEPKDNPEKTPVYAAVIRCNPAILAILINAKATVQFSEEYDLVSIALRHLISPNEKYSNDALKLLKLLVVSGAPIYESTIATANELLERTKGAKFNKFVRARKIVQNFLEKVAKTESTSDRPLLIEQ